jgi:hypothetical protein
VQDAGDSEKACCKKRRIDRIAPEPDHRIRPDRAQLPQRNQHTVAYFEASYHKEKRIPARRSRRRHDVSFRGREPIPVRIHPVISHQMNIVTAAAQLLRQRHRRE